MNHRGHLLLELSGWAAASLALYSLASRWATTVSSHVPGPYLDEVFHVRQAQAYCERRFSQWDPKITTPPGLYLISYALYCMRLGCTIETLRQTNAALLSFVLFNACLHYLLHKYPRCKSKDSAAIPTAATKALFQKIHTTLNVCLFPPLFFFSALYYTDVASTACILVGAWLQCHPTLASYPIARGILLVLNGILALFLRQTNIFWVAVFPAGLDLVAALGASPNNRQKGFSRNWMRLNSIDVARRSWVEGDIYDPVYDQAELTDYFLVAFSIAIAAVSKYATAIRALTPYLILVASFIGFVIWNGSVVLGDKSNHVATLHLPQMLYIWPLIAFFSFPLMYPHVLAVVIPQKHLDSATGVPLQGRQGKTRRGWIYMILRFAFALFIAEVAIYKNTIVHPFTLADNRHYVFYIFRILLRHGSIKYMVAPIYIVCGWIVLQTFYPPNLSKDRFETKRKTKDVEYDHYGSQIPTTSYVGMWLLTTTMTLVTAPLVEPRYFILPWIFWRLGVPRPSTQYVEKVTNRHMTRVRYIEQILNHGDRRLYLETVWLVIVNVATGYIFLFWGFEWAQEKGKIQRFMW